MNKNSQPVEKQDRGSGLNLAVNSIFYTIQGEGPFVGSPAVFVRLAGCNLQCPMCDTEYTSRQQMGWPQVIETVQNESYFSTDKKGLVVITGGEPFRQNLYPLVSNLLTQGFKVQIETNGTLYCDLPFDHPDLSIVCSPKTGTINKKLAPHIAAMKYVATVNSLGHSPDGLPTHALEHPNGGMLARPPQGFTGQIYLQPVDEQDDIANKSNLSAVVKSCMDHGYRLCLQVHKIIGVA
ncbi:MAG: 7-carboxy-7-deazaguanine synthase QueE [Bdellovibrionales bacterium]|nr:7-carboxy-7-deazaguanine synthase QueE [Bdellovibrionales bacterium]